MSIPILHSFLGVAPLTTLRIMVSRCRRSYPCRRFPCMLVSLLLKVWVLSCVVGVSKAALFSSRRVETKVETTQQPPPPEAAKENNETAIVEEEKAGAAEKEQRKPASTASKKTTEPTLVEFALRLELHALSEQLQQSQNGYVSLQAEKDFLEQSFRDQIDLLQSRLSKAESRALTFEQSLAQAIEQGREKIQAQRDELGGQVSECRRAHDVLKVQRDEFQEQSRILISNVKERDMELSVTKQKLFGVRQDLLASNEKLRELERKSNQSLLMIAWSRIRETRGLGPMVAQSELIGQWIHMNFAMPIVIGVHGASLEARDSKATSLFYLAPILV